jgi:hypothetical protein
MGEFQCTPSSILGRTKHMAPVPSAFNISEDVFVEKETVK